MKNQCLRCGYGFDASTDFFDPNATPHPGDITMCLNCGQLHIFNHDMSVRLMRQGEFDELDADTRRDLMRLIVTRTRVVTTDLRREKQTD